MPTVFRVVIALKNPLFGLLLALVVGLTGCGGSQPKFSSIDLTGAEFGRAFRLSDPDGKERTLADFRGEVVMVFFGFVQCPQICPTALARAVAVREKLDSDGAKVQVIFVTVDPERDTPEILKAYAAAFGPGVLALYGDLERTRAVAAEFKVFYAKVPTGSSYTIDHSALTYVFDGKGRLRLGVRDTSSADEVATDLRVLMKTDSRS
jgi:protein SCO1/2